MSYVVYTRKNCTLSEWREHVLKEYTKLGIDPESVRPLREQHAWEGGDTTTGWAQHVEHQQRMQARTRLVKLNNPDT